MDIHDIFAALKLNQLFTEKKCTYVVKDLHDCVKGRVYCAF